MRREVRVASSWTDGISKCRPRAGERVGEGDWPKPPSPIPGVPADMPQEATTMDTHWGADTKGGISFHPIHTNLQILLPISANRRPCSPTLPTHKSHPHPIYITQTQFEFELPRAQGTFQHHRLAVLKRRRGVVIVPREPYTLSSRDPRDTQGFVRNGEEV